MIQRVFLDTNVIVDLLGERESFYVAAARIATKADKGEIKLIISALTYANVYYLLSRFEDKEKVKEKIGKLKAIAETSDLTDTIINKALSSRFNDFEDALQYFSALESNCTILITRNEKDFKVADIPVMAPNEFLTSNPN